MSTISCSKKGVDEAGDITSDDRVERLVERGDRAKISGRLGTAERRYRSAYELDNNHHEAAQKVVAILLVRGKIVEAKEVATSFLANNRDVPLAYSLVADTEEASGNYPQAIHAMTERVRRWNKDAEAYSMRGLLRIQNKESRLGRADLKKAHQLEPQNAQWLANYSRGLYEAGNYNGSRRQAKQAIKKDGRLAEAHYVLGLIDRRQGRYKNAVVHHEIAANNNAARAEYHFALGISYNYLERNTESEKALQKATELAPANATYWYAHGEILRSLQRNVEAAGSYRKALAIKAGYEKAAEKLGLVLYKAGDHSQAEKQLTTILRDRPSLAGPYYVLALVYRDTDRRSLAREAVEKYLSLAPEDHPDRQAAQKLANRL